MAEASRDAAEALAICIWYMVYMGYMVYIEFKIGFVRLFPGKLNSKLDFSTFPGKLNSKLDFSIFPWKIEFKIGFFDFSREN